MKTFEQFRRELADAVTVAINSGQPIGHDYSSECCCPLGVRTPCSNFPTPLYAADFWGIEHTQAASFINGFGQCGTDYGHPQFNALGRLYRQRFVEGK